LFYRYSLTEKYYTGQSFVLYQASSSCARASTVSLFGICFVSSAFADIDWQPCEGVSNTQFQCARVLVPLNHQQHIDSSAAYESGEDVVSIALARLPASDSANKKGSLFLNPGGPRGSGVDFIFDKGKYLFTEEVRRNYDLIGFDPRGIGRSDVLTCFEDSSEIAPFIELPLFPVTPEEVNRRKEVGQLLSDFCHSRAGDLINHMSTADVARDLDLLRQAVGDEKLHFAGYSYGSYLGVTYANLFPENVGAMVVDGVLDPIAWSTGRGWQAHFLPYTTRIRSAEGAQDSLHEFFRTCDEGGMEVCDLANNAESRYTSVIERIREEPIVFTSGDGSEQIVDYATFVNYTLIALYLPSSWPYFASVVAAIDEDMELNEIANRLRAFLQSVDYEDDLADIPIEQPSFPGYYGVACSDSDNPYLYESWSWAAELSDSLYQYFGSLWTWESSVCHSWKGSKESRYAGEFKAKTDNPVLVVSTLFDPATPYHGAKKVRKLLANSRLLTVNGWGHTSLFTSECANNIVSDYLLSGNLPENDTSCDPDTTPFGATLPAGHSSDRQNPASTTPYNREVKEELRRKALKDMFPKRLR
jgi:pimeloyl-ACP methyl ester carboxylesterase